MRSFRRKWLAAGLMVALGAAGCGKAPVAQVAPVTVATDPAAPITKVEPPVDDGIGAMRHPVGQKRPSLAVFELGDQHIGSLNI